MSEIVDIKPTVGGDDDEDADVHNPVAVELAIRKIANRTAKGVSECARRLDAWRTATRVYDQAYARAYKNATGTNQYARKYDAVLATEKEAEARDTAEVAYKYAAGIADFLEAELSAWQSINKSVNNMYQVAGVGRT
ncbi:hypothetical protein [Rhodococcus koreensis]